MDERAGTEFDGEVVRAFVKMMNSWEPQIAQVDDPAPEAAKTS
jgi:hypothetical protein